MYVNSLGLVLNREKTTGPDKLLTVFSLEFGKIRVLSAGSQRSAARLMMSTEPLVETEFMFFARPSNLGRMKAIGGRLNDLFPGLRSDLKRYTVACQAAEVVNMLTYEQIKNEKKYDLLKRTFKLLEDAAHPERIYSAFLLRFLKLCGYGLRFDRCVACSSGDISEFRLSVRKGGVLCGKCMRTDNLALVVDAQTLAYLKDMSVLPGRDLDMMDSAPRADKIAENLCNSYLCEYIRWPLKTKEFARDMGRAL